MQEQQLRRNKSRFPYVLACVTGGIIGPIAVSLINILMQIAFSPQVFKDGQYVLVFVCYVPQGIWLGLVSGIAVTAVRDGYGRKAGTFILVSLIPVVIAALPFGLNSLSGILFYFGVALVWAGGLFCWAVRLLEKPRSPAV